MKYPDTSHTLLWPAVFLVRDPCTKRLVKWPPSRIKNNVYIRWRLPWDKC